MTVESSMLTTFTWLRKGVLSQGLNECRVVKCNGKVNASRLLPRAAMKGMRAPIRLHR